MSRRLFGRLAGMGFLALGAAVSVGLPGAAQAFCGTYVGEAGAELTSGASQVVLVRQQDRTVLTLANDVEGSVRDFAVVIPVPEVLDQEDVRVVDDSLLDTVAAYSGPRLVEYTCEDFRYEWDPDYYDYGSGGRGCALGCSEASFAVDDTDADFDSQAPSESLDVTVEAEFAAGEYDIVILSSEDSADLLTWLSQEGYGVSEQAQDLLGEYIDGSSRFLAAKVRLDDVPTADGPEGRPYLSPLQITYTSEAFTLPIRLGTVNSPGTQDLIVYTLTGGRGGPVGIANYDEISWTTESFDNDCLYDPDQHGELGDWMDQRMQASVDANQGAGWMMTYTWGPAKCDPCPPGGPLDDAVLAELGFEGSSENAQFTRLWMRYDAQAATQDLVLYKTGDSAQRQLRYIQRTDGLEQFFPVCGEGWAEADSYPTCAEQADVDEAQQSSIGPWWLGLSALGLFAGLGVVLRRRR